MTLMLFLVFLQLHTTQKSQIFPLSLQLKGQPARFLDSPDPMTGMGPHLPHMAKGIPPSWVGLYLGGLNQCSLHSHRCPILSFPNTQVLRS